MIKRRSGNANRSETHEASMRRAVTTYFRAAQLGPPVYLLAMLHLNHMFTISHDPLFFGWIAFGQVRNHVIRHKTAPPYLDHFAPYLTAASFYITRYIKNLGAKGREMYRVVIARVNVVMRQEVFAESIVYGVEPREVTEQIKRAHKAQLSFSKRPVTAQVPGTCTGGKPHGLCVQSLHGAVCTVCGRVGQRQYKQHFNDQVASKAKLPLMSLASQKYIADGAMTTLIRVSDPVRSMTRGQFVAWTERAFRVPYMGDTKLDLTDMEALRCGSYHLPTCYREWMLFLYDFIKDWTVNRGREERINNNWAHAIWIYGYLVWVTVHRSMASGAEENLVQAIARCDDSNTTVYSDPLERRYRFLETHFETASVRYFRVQGSTYRFYPPKFLHPKFEKDMGSGDDSVTVFADSNVRSLVRLGESQLLKRQKVRAQFWDGRYVAAVTWPATSSPDQGPKFQVRATPKSDECYFHIMVPKHTRVKFAGLKYAQFVLQVQPWADKDLLARHPKAAHYFVHVTPLRGPTVCAQLVYRVGSGDEKTLSIRGLVPTMSKQVFQIGKSVPILIRSTRITLTPMIKEWVQAQMPD